MTHNQIAAEANRIEKEKNRITEEYETERNRINSLAQEETKRHNEVSEQLEMSSQAIKDRELLLNYDFKNQQLALDAELGRAKIGIEQFSALEQQANNLRNFDINVQKNEITKKYNEDTIWLGTLKQGIEQQKVDNDLQLGLANLGITAAKVANEAKLGEINALTNRLNALNNIESTRNQKEYWDEEAQTHRISAEASATQSVTSQLQYELAAKKYYETKFVEGLGNVGSFFGGLGKFISAAIGWR